MPTIKQKKAFDKMVENGGNISKAMVDADYSPATAKTPQKLTESEGWRELMATHLPDAELALKHKELLNSSGVEKLTFDKKMEDFEIRDIMGEIAGCKVLYIKKNQYDKVAYVQVPDVVARDKALDKAYKLKGSYAPEKSQALNVNINARNVDNPEIEALRLKFEEELRMKLTQ